MRVSEFDEVVATYFIVFVVVSAIAFFVVLIKVMTKGCYVTFRKIIGGGNEKFTLKDLTFVLPCLILPIGGISAAYFFDFAIEGKVALPTLGFFTAGIVITLLAWRMEKKRKL